MADEVPCPSRAVLAEVTLGHLDPTRLALIEQHLQSCPRCEQTLQDLHTEDTKLARQVALKVMLPRIAAHPTAKERFLREARAAARLKSDHIVTIYQVDEVNGVPYLAMELLEGQSLDDALRDGQSFALTQI